MLYLLLLLLLLLLLRLLLLLLLQLKLLLFPLLSLLFQLFLDFVNFLRQQVIVLGTRIRHLIHVPFDLLGVRNEIVHAFVEHGRRIR
uniref:Putative secreted peptide n=1 Tax=Anopheles braziliensis TaxID=58242 RepID=A0A2M3ZPB9_9DIPT